MAGKGGAWKVAYADFATAMMAFFLVMWITTQSKPVKEAVAEYFENPEGNNQGVRSTSEQGEHASLTIGDYEKGRGSGSGLVKTDLNSSATVNSQGTAARLPPRIEITHAKLRFKSIGTGVLFANDSLLLDEVSRKRLDVLVPLLLPEKGTIEVQALVQRIPPDPAAAIKDLQELSYARCQEVVQYLVGRGIARRRIRVCVDGSGVLQLTETNSRSTGVSREYRQVRSKEYNLFVFLTEAISDKAAKVDLKPAEDLAKKQNSHSRPAEPHSKPKEPHAHPKGSRGKSHSSHAKPNDAIGKSKVPHGKDPYAEPQDPDDSHSKAKVSKDNSAEGPHRH